MLPYRYLTKYHWSKFVKICVVSYLVVLPWNATALNQDNADGGLFNAKLGRDPIDNLLVKSLMEIDAGKLDQALVTINELIRQAPNFRLAYLIRGDLLASHAQAISGFGNLGIDPSPASQEEIEGLRAEAMTRVRHYFTAENIPAPPSDLVKLDDTQKHVIVVDTNKSRLFLYKKVGDGLEYVTDYYVTIGKNGADKKSEGDKRTPIGLYFAGAKLTKPLDPFYGDGAFPLNYPNELDQLENRTGSGIWLHGTPQDTFSRPPRASDGCVVLSNRDLKALTPVLQHGNTPVIITQHADQLNKQTQMDADSLAEAIETWRGDWQAQDTDAYLSHYSKRFFYSDGNLDKWANYKRGIQASKPKVNIEINHIGMFNYPNAVIANPVVVVNFEQDFRSPTLQNKMRKRQYWVFEGNQWKILYEGSA